MALSYSDPGEILQLDGFISDDGNHIIRWLEPPWTEIPDWWCITHNQPYYTVCALEDTLPKHS